MKISINDGAKIIEVEGGGSLLFALAKRGIFLPSACGGQAICGRCRCMVESGGGEVLRNETALLTEQEIREGFRLACQVKLGGDISIRIPDDYLAIRRGSGRVMSARFLSPLIREVVIDLPLEEPFAFDPGSYIQVFAPRYELNFSEIEVPEEFRDVWDKYGWFDLKASNSEPELFRAYSPANYPAEGKLVILNVRLALPPRSTGFPPGKVSSYLFGLKPGDSLDFSGPYGEFHVMESEREMVYIGGGVGVAPIRSQLLHLFRTLGTKRRVSFWYGARTRREICYEQDFRALASRYENFSYHVALSEPAENDEWDGPVGFIHQVAYDEYLSKHAEPDKIEYYLCGPPPMLKAALEMLRGLGVEDKMIRFDDLG